MKKILPVILLCAIVAFLSACSSNAEKTTVVKTDITEFLGQWTIDIENGSVGWIEVRWKTATLMPISCGEEEACCRYHRFFLQKIMSLQYRDQITL